MPFIFDGSSLPADAAVDPEELLKQRQQKQQQEQQQRQKQAQSKKQEEERKKKQQQQQSRPGRLDRPLQGIGKFLEENVAIPVLDTVDNVFQGNQKSPDDIARERAQKRKEFQQASDEFDQITKGSVQSEAVKAIAGGVEDFAEGLINLPGQVTTLFGNKYEPIRTNIIRENDTQAGDAFRTIVRYVTGGFAGGAVTRGAFTAGRVGVGLAAGRGAQGFVEDFLGADGTGDDETLIGRTPFTRWLQTSDENNPIQNRAIVGVEGALFEIGFGQAADAIRALRKARRPTEAQLNARIQNLAKENGLTLDPTGTADEIDQLLNQTRQMLKDPNLPAKQRADKLRKELEQIRRERQVNAGAAQAGERLRKLLADQYAQDNFGATLDYTRKVEQDLALRLIKEDPQRVRLEQLIEEAAKGTDNATEVKQVLRDRIEGLAAAKQLDDIADTVQYGGPPDELVYDGLQSITWERQLFDMDDELKQLDELMRPLRESLDENTSQIADFQRQIDEINEKAAGLDVEALNTPTQQELLQSFQIPSLNLSKGQVRVMQEIGLPEGVTITPGRRVVGLTVENFDQVQQSLRQAGEQGNAVAARLADRLDAVERPNAGNIRSREQIIQELEELRAQRSDLFGQAIQTREARLPSEELIQSYQAKVDEIKLRRQAIIAKASGKVEQFVADYMPVDMTTKNVTSIRKESGGSFQPGIDFYFEDKRFPALLEGRVKEIGRQGGPGSGYGNYVVVESIDPKTGQPVDVLYAHLADGSIKVREGDAVGVGQEIATQGGTGRVVSADGTIASVDFLAAAPKGSKSMTPYARWSELADEIIAGIRGGSIQPTQTAKAAAKVPTATPEAVQGAMQQADELVQVKPRSQALEEGAEISQLVNVKPRNTATEVGPVDAEPSVVNTPLPGKASLTDIEVQSVILDEDGYDLIRRINDEIERDVRYTRGQTLEQMSEADALARDFLEVSDEELAEIIKAESTVIDGDNLLLSTRGLTATGMALQEAQRQIKDLGYSATNLFADGAPEASKEAARLLDRMEFMLTVRMQNKRTTSGKLREQFYIGESLGQDAPTLSRKAEALKEIEAKNTERINQDQAAIQNIRQVKRALLDGDPVATKQVERVVNAVAMSHATPENMKRWPTLLEAIGRNVDGGYIQSLLSGPRTLARNFAGNFYQSIGHPLQAAIATVNPATPRTVRYQAVAAIQATQEAYRDMTDLIPRLWNVHSKHLDPEFKEYKLWDEDLRERIEMIKADADAGNLSWAEAMTYNTAINFRKLLESPFMSNIMRVMGATDSFFKIVAARQVAARRAAVDALEQLGDAPITGKRAEQYAELYDQFKEQHMQRVLSPDGVSVIDEEAEQLGKVFTFQTEHHDPVTKALNKVADIPLMRTLGLTFINTPAAILKASANLTPGLSRLLKKSDEAYKNGDEYYRAMRDGAEAMSYIIGLTAFVGGWSGTITGAGPLRGDVRDTWLQTHDPYHVYLPGGVKFSYQGMEPATFILGLFADMGSLGLGSRSKNENALLAIPGAISSNIVNKSYLTQLSTVASLVSAKDEYVLKRFGENIARGLVPFSGLRSQTNEVIDLALREVRSQLEPTWEWFLNKHTGLGASYRNPQRLDPVTGKPLVRDGVEGPLGHGLALINMTAPFGLRFSKNRFEKVHQFLFDEGIDVQDVYKKLGGQDLTNAEMTEYVRLRADNGGLKKALLDYFYSDQYQKVDKPNSMLQKKEGVEPTDTYAAQHIKNIIRFYHDRAVAQMELGLTDVSRGYKERRQKALQQAIQQERRQSDGTQQLRLQDYPY